jgi:hypothetical protein
MLYQLSYLGAAGAGELRRSGGYRGTALPLSSGCWGKRRKERRWNDDGGWKRALGFTVPGIGTRTAFEGRSACLANDRQGLNAGSISIAAISLPPAYLAGWRVQEPAPKGVSNRGSLVNGQVYQLAASPTRRCPMRCVKRLV